MKEAATKKTLATSVPKDELAAAGKFGGHLLDIGWRLALSVIIFLWGGSWLDKRFDTAPWFTLAGFGLVIASFVVIVRQILQQIPRSQGGLKND